MDPLLVAVSRPFMARDDGLKAGRAEDDVERRSS